MAEPSQIRPIDAHAQDGRTSRAAREDQPIGELVRELIQDIGDLVRGEIQLARHEITSDLGKMAGGAAFAAAGGFIALLGLIYLIFGGILALGSLIGTALAAVIVGAAILVVGGILALVGVNRLKSANPVPDKTINAVKEDAEWLKNRMS